ncbi:MAG: FKBP-type peptidyl-prolyl cis-trans isomerase [Spirochaetaceae bacterium]|jgi:FKBP-type peptidyl-prolyl cis-trans isomerase FkpA|nr:FKBP-type peptidyl-prolyl cis-trans isomerase [Spirochaetaceae bacterium]
MLKKTVIAIILATTVLFICGAGGKSEKSAAPVQETPVPAPGADTDISYAFGVVLGSDLKQTGLKFDYDALLQGLKESIEGQNTRFTMEEAIGRIQTAYAEAMAEKAEENKQREAQFLAENGRKPGIITTSSGLQYEVITEGTGGRPAATDTVSVQYEGSLIDGTVFDSSYANGGPIELPLDGVIPGWTEGILLMREGGSMRLFIPSVLAYGEQGAGNFIPPNSTLIFKVDLISIVK